MHRNTSILHDDIGRIELVDSMPQRPEDFHWFYVNGENQLTNAEAAIVEAARVSVKSSLKGFEKDKKLLNYLYNNRHTSPFEQVVFKFRVKAPLFVVRQWFRHRTASYNEVSARYTELTDEFYIPIRWRVQDHANKQGSLYEEGAMYHKPFADMLMAACERDYATYLSYLEQGVAREMARMVLPVNIYTEFVYTVNLHNLMHFIRLRNKPEAQYEIKVYAEWLADFVKKCLPNVENLQW